MNDSFRLEICVTVSVELIRYSQVNCGHSAHLIFHTLQISSFEFFRKLCLNAI